MFLFLVKFFCFSQSFFVSRKGLVSRKVEMIGSLSLTCLSISLLP